MKTITKTLIAVACFVLLANFAGFAQKVKPVPPYKITDIKAVPFDEITGKFRDPVDPEQWFGNDLSMSLFVTIELTGPAGEFVPNRKVQIM